MWHEELCTSTDSRCSNESDGDVDGGSGSDGVAVSSVADGDCVRNDHVGISGKISSASST